MMDCFTAGVSFLLFDNIVVGPKGVVHIIKGTLSTREKAEDEKKEEEKKKEAPKPAAVPEGGQADGPAEAGSREAEISGAKEVGISRPNPQAKGEGKAEPL